MARRRTACASCTATSPRTSSAASSRARIFAQYMGREGGITARARRQRALRRPHEGLRRDGLDAARHDARSPPASRWRSSCAASSACAITWFGDGSTSRGDFHEAMNWAGVQKLPVIFVLENNQYAYSTPLDQQFAVDPVERAAAYGFPGVKVDGNDPEAMFEATRAGARARARRRGPDADRGRDHAHARPRRARRHEVRAEREDRGVAREGPDRPPGARLEALGVDVAGDPRRGQGRDRRGRRGGAGDRRCPTATRRSDGLFADEPALLEDGNAPWCGFTRRAPEPDAHA